MSSPSAIQNTCPYQNEPKWKSEKAIARTAFDAALKRESHQVIQEARQKANQIKEPADPPWDSEQYLTERRKEIDRKFGYRYSQLIHVFERLLHEILLRDEEPHGLREDKLKPIRSFAKFLAEDTAA